MRLLSRLRTSLESLKMIKTVLVVSNMPRVRDNRLMIITLQVLGNSDSLRAWSR